jgi:uncharacterized membrane-anchored protein
MKEHLLNRISAFAPIFMSILELFAVARSYRHASHEDGNWHIWALMLLVQIPILWS